MSWVDAERSAHVESYECPTEVMITRIFLISMHSWQEFEVMIFYTDSVSALPYLMICSGDFTR